MAVGALEPQFYAALLHGLFAPEGVPAGLPDRADRGRWPELRARFAARFAQRTQAQWTAAFSGTDACVAPVRSLAEAPSDPHLAARGSYVTVDGVTQPAPAPRFSAPGPAGPAGGAGSARGAGGAGGALAAGRIAAVGAHTREVLAGLGFDDADELIGSGAAWQA
jgi:alpha-methylacyl-CoA racemase